MKFEILKGTPKDGGETDLTKASTTLTAGRLTAIDSNGYVVHAVTGDRIRGLANEDKASSDTTTAPINMSGATKDIIYIAEVDVGTPAQTHVGEDVDLHANGGVDLTASTNDDCHVIGLLDSTHVLVTLNKTVY
jgi:hypothetical protein